MRVILCCNIIFKSHEYKKIATNARIKKISISHTYIYCIIKAEKRYIDEERRDSSENPFFACL
jgi:hypothetical protein